MLGFPYIFKGALIAQATAINEQMKLAAASELAKLAREQIPENIKRELELIHHRMVGFGREYIIPSPFDPRLLTQISNAVAQAARQSGVARS